MQVQADSKKSLHKVKLAVTLSSPCKGFCAVVWGLLQLGHFRKALQSRYSTSPGFFLAQKPDMNTYLFSKLSPVCGDCTLQEWFQRKISAAAWENATAQKGDCQSCNFASSFGASMHETW